jgi:hypothetical protein
LTHKYRKIEFTDEESILLRIDVEYKLPPAALIISYGQSRGKLDIYISKTNPIPTESDCDLSSIERRPHSLTITGEHGQFSTNYIYINMISSESMSIKLKT